MSARLPFRNINLIASPQVVPNMNQEDFSNDNEELYTR